MVTQKLSSITDNYANTQGDKAFWACGYYVGTVGNVTEEAIKKYIAEQEIYAKAEDKPGKSFF